MPIYSEYLDKLSGDFAALSAERKTQLRRISEIRGRDVLVFASAIGKPQTSIDYSDIMPLSDQLDALTGPKLDVILETPGGSGETTEDIVRLFRRNREEVNFIIPGTAKSAGTIMVMSGDDILMSPVSALGPIDAQVARDGKFFSAEAFLEGLKKIKEETDERNSLNRAYIPILQAISPGEIEAARNALKFGKTLAADWLRRYKFSHWLNHKSTGVPVTEDERTECANRVADELCSHSRWLSHGRSLKIDDLRTMGINVTDFGEQAELHDAIKRYHILLRMSFETNIYKLYETPTSQILRFQGAQNTKNPQNIDHGELAWKCPRCGTAQKIQLNFKENLAIRKGLIPFPKDNKLTCPACHVQTDLSSVRLKVEAQTKKKIL